MKKTLLFTTMLAFTGMVQGQMAGKWQWKNPSNTTAQMFNLTYVGNNTYYAAGAAGTIVKSIDGGASWQLVNHGSINQANSLIEHSFFLNANTAFVSNGASAYKTTNGGNSWTDVSTDFNGGTHLAFADEQTGWKSAMGEVFKTTNGGSSWSVITLPDVSSDDRTSYIKMFTAQEGWLMRSPGKLYKTSDGNTWNKVFLPAVANGSEVVYFNDANHGLYCRPNFNDTIYLTTNGGNTWSSSLIPFYDKGDRTALAYAGNNTILIGLYNYNSQNNKVKIARSTDGGATWMYTDLPDYVGRINFICMKDELNGLALNGFGGVLSTSDGGATWNRLNACGGMTAEDLDFKGNNGLLVGHYGVVYTRDGGTTFKQAVVTNTTPGIGTDEFNAVTWINESTALAMGYGGYAYFSNDTGATWNQGNYTWFIGNLYDVYHHAASGKIFAVGRSADGVKNYTVTTNGGNSWTAYQMPGAFDIQRIYFYDDNLGFATGADSVFYATRGINQAALWKTTDGGTSWTKITLPDLGNGYSSAKDIVMIDANNGWLVGSKIWKTTDGGNTWTTVPPGIMLANMYGVHFEDAQNGHIIGVQGYYIYTTDGGSTWTQGNLHTYGTLKHFAKIGNKIGIVTDGGGLIINDGSPSSGIKESLSSGNLHVVYPNPTNGKVNIRLNAYDTRTGADLVVMDLTGKVLYHKTSKEPTEELDLTGLGRGLYLVKITTGNLAQTTRLVME